MTRAEFIEEIEARGLVRVNRGVAKGSWKKRLRNPYYIIAWPNTPFSSLANNQTLAGFSYLHLSVITPELITAVAGLRKESK